MNYTNIELLKETIYKIAECAIENKLIYFLLGIVIFQEYAYTIKTERLYNNIYEALRRNEDTIYVEEESNKDDSSYVEEESDEDDSSYVEEEESNEDDSSYIEEESNEDDSSYEEEESNEDEEDDSTKINNLEEKYAYLEDIINTIILNNENEEYKYDYNKLENETKYIENYSDGEDL